MVKEFREFILRGNLLDLAVAFVLGAAFSALVTSFVKNLITPLIAVPRVSVGDPTEGQALRLLHGRSGPRRLAAVCLR
jgi:large-conductance mechanosensitive channel